MMFKEINKEQEKYLLSRGFKKMTCAGEQDIQYSLRFENGTSIYILTNYLEFRMSITGFFRGASVEEVRLLTNELNDCLKMIDELNEDMKNYLN